VLWQCWLGDSLVETLLQQSPKVLTTRNLDGKNWPIKQKPKVLVVLVAAAAASLYIDWELFLSQLKHCLPARSLTTSVCFGTSANVFHHGLFLSQRLHSVQSIATLAMLFIVAGQPRSERSESLVLALRVGSADNLVLGTQFTQFFWKLDTLTSLCIVFFKFYLYVPSELTYLLTTQLFAPQTNASPRY